MLRFHNVEKVEHSACRQSGECSAEIVGHAGAVGFIVHMLGVLLTFIDFEQKFQFGQVHVGGGFEVPPLFLDVLFDRRDVFGCQFGHKSLVRQDFLKGLRNFIIDRHDIVERRHLFLFSHLLLLFSFC